MLCNCNKCCMQMCIYCRNSLISKCCVEQRNILAKSKWAHCDDSMNSNCPCYVCLCLLYYYSWMIAKLKRSALQQKKDNWVPWKHIDSFFLVKQEIFRISRHISFYFWKTQFLLLENSDNSVQFLKNSVLKMQKLSFLNLNGVDVGTNEI